MFIVFEVSTFTFQHILPISLRYRQGIEAGGGLSALAIPPLNSDHKNSVTHLERRPIRLGRH